MYCSAVFHFGLLLYVLIAEYLTNLFTLEAGVKKTYEILHVHEMFPYHKARGSQSLNGMSSLAACLTSSSSTIPPKRCSTCRLATLSHSTSGGRWECALRGKKNSTFKITRFDLLWSRHNCCQYRLVAAKMSEMSSSIWCEHFVK